MDDTTKKEQQDLDKVEAEIKENLGDGVHVIRERIGGCKMCGKEEDLRFGWCWDCAEAQNILAVGRDMYQDEDGSEVKLPIKQVNERLKMMIDKGWKKVKV